MTTINTLIELVQSNGAILSVLGLIAIAIGYAIRGRELKALDKTKQIETEIREIISKETELPIPETVEIQKDEIVESLHEAGIDADEDPSKGSVNLIFTDKNYYAPTSDGIEETTDSLDVISLLPYRSERYDCDDFAMTFKVLTSLVNGANSVGIVLDWSEGHAYNVLVDSKGNLYWPDPANNNASNIDKLEWDLDSGAIVF